MASNLPAVPELTDDQLALVRRMSAQGCKPELIRQALVAGKGALPPSAWAKLRAPLSTGDPSPLAIALEAGKADLAHEVVSFFLGKMREGSSDAARWLGDRVCKFKDEDADRAPKIMIQINAPMTEAEYREVHPDVDDD